MKHHIVVSYHSFKDPIFSGLMLKYLFHFQKTHKGHFFHLFTFEQKQYSVSKADTRTHQVELDKNGIGWKPLSYHSGGSLTLLKKLWDFFGLIFNILWVKARYRPITIIGFTTLSGVMSFLIGRVLRIKFVGLNIEPHSQYMVDFSIWSERSIKYKLLRFLESILTKYGDRIAVPTRGDKERILKQFDRDVDFVPTCIDVEDFYFSKRDRNLIRTELGIDDTFKAIIYVGKFGGIYFEIDEVSEYISKIEKDGREKICFVVISPMESQSIRLSLAEKGVKDFRVLTSVPFERLSSYLSAADAGILILPEYPSQHFRCPIKTANYLACGLPIIVNKSVGDEADLVMQNRVGWVLDLEAPSIDFSKIPGRRECINLVKKERNIQKVVEYLEDCIV